MANAKRNRAQNDSADRKPAAANRMIEPPRNAPETERSLTHSPYFNGPLYQRMSEDSERQVAAGSADHRASPSDHRRLQDATHGRVFFDGVLPWPATGGSSESARRRHWLETSAAMFHDRRSRVTPQIIWTADEEHKNTSGERQGVSPPCRSHDRTGLQFQNTY